MTNLSTTQIDLLRSAAATPDGAIDTPAGSRNTVVSLVKRGFLISLPQAEGLGRLIITEAGRAEIGSEQPAEPRSTAPAPIATAASAKGKIDMLVDLLSRPDGTTVEAMTAATGWQAHSVRGAISGVIKKGRGLSVTSEKLDSGRIYRVVTGAVA